jgi:hypothetical protein
LNAEKDTEGKRISGRKQTQSLRTTKYCIQQYPAYKHPFSYCFVQQYKDVTAGDTLQLSEIPNFYLPPGLEKLY